MIRRPALKAVIFTFGESITDSRVLKEIVAAARPDLPQVEAKAQPIILRRDADCTKHRKRADDIAALIRAAGLKAKVVAVVVHRDLDAVEPRDTIEDRSPDEEALRSDLKGVADMDVQVVVTSPAWEMEAWWLMWPDQVAKHRPCWNRLRDRTGKRVDRIENVKEVLTRELRPHNNPKIPTYTETDGPLLAAMIRADGRVREPRGESVAFRSLIKKLDAVVV